MEKIENWRNSSWKNSISYVEQNVFLFNDSILKNITLDEETNYNRQRLDHIIEGINLKNFIEKNQEGLQRIIAENNSNISGGEKQKIAIARELYQTLNLFCLTSLYQILMKIVFKLLKIILHQLKI